MASPIALLEQHEAALASLLEISTAMSAYHEVDEATFLRITEVHAAARQIVTSHDALVAGEVARRSAPELGSQGLAQRRGFRTPEEFVRVATHTSGRDASTAVRVGRLAIDAERAGTVDQCTGEVRAAAEPWLTKVAQALSDGRISVAAVDAIRTGLGTPTSAVTEATLATAAERLCHEATRLDPDRLLRRARDLRDELDSSGIAIREHERRARRAARMVDLPNGMARLIWDMDPETRAVAKAIFDRATSPKTGGPRFANPDAAAVDRILKDDRTTPQLLSDAILELLRLGVATDPSFLVGGESPAVRVLVTKSSLNARMGHGRIEGQNEPVSIATVERIGCSSGYLPIMFDEQGQALDLGREIRLFNRRQRIALAARDGGCRWPGCERPPSWTEAHHIVFWARDRGKTDVADGILLCKHHHLLLHNNGWEIVRDGGDYWLTPPPDVDRDRTPRLMATKSAALKDLLRERVS